MINPIGFQQVHYLKFCWVNCLIFFYKSVIWFIFNIYLCIVLIYYSNCNYGYFSYTSCVNFFESKYILILNVHVFSFTCTISYVYGRAPKTVLHARKNYNLWRPELGWTLVLFHAECKNAGYVKLILLAWIKWSLQFSSQRSLVIWQKGESQNRWFKKTKHAKFFQKSNISYPLIHSPALRFTLLPYYRWDMISLLTFSCLRVGFH